MIPLLVTGSRSGLGRFLHERLGGRTWTRTTSPDDRHQLRAEGASVILHCAFRPGHAVTSDQLADYVDDNLLLTHELLAIPHDLFVSLSSIDVYPHDDAIHDEGERIDLSKAQGPYAICKLMSEALVRRRATRHLILRCGSLVGAGTRRNVLVRLIEGDPSTSLTADSVLNWVRHEDVLGVLERALTDGVTGTLNVAMAENAVLADVAARLGATVEYGAHRYDAGRIDQRAAARLWPGLNRTSMDIAIAYAEQHRRLAMEP